MSNELYPTVQGLGFTWTRTPEFSTRIEKAPNRQEQRIPQMANPRWHWTLVYDFLKDFDVATQYTDLRKLLGFFEARGGQFDTFIFIDPDDYEVGPAMVAGVPNLAAQLQVVNDGVGHYYSPIQHSVGGQYPEDVYSLSGDITVYANGVLQTGGFMADPAASNYIVLTGGIHGPGYYFGGLYIAWSAPSAWEASHSYAAGATILDPAGHIQEAMSRGTSGTTIPTFNDVGGDTEDPDRLFYWTDRGYNPGPTQPITVGFYFNYAVRFEEDTQEFEKWAQSFWTIGGDQGERGSGTVKLVGVLKPDIPGQSSWGSLGTGGGGGVGACGLPWDYVIIRPTKIRLNQGAQVQNFIMRSAQRGFLWNWGSHGLYSIGDLLPYVDYSGYRVPASIDPSKVRQVYLSFSGTYTPNTKDNGWGVVCPIAFGPGIGVSYAFSGTVITDCGRTLPDPRDVIKVSLATSLFDPNEQNTKTTHPDPSVFGFSDPVYIVYYDVC